MERPVPHKYVWSGDEPVYVPDLGREVSPGDEVEFADEPNNPLFVNPAAAPKQPAPKPEKD